MALEFYTSFSQLHYDLRLYESHQTTVQPYLVYKGSSERLCTSVSVARIGKVHDFVSTLKPQCVKHVIFVRGDVRGIRYRTGLSRVGLAHEARAGTCRPPLDRLHCAVLSAVLVWSRATAVGLRDRVLVRGAACTRPFCVSGCQCHHPICVVLYVCAPSDLCRVRPRCATAVPCTNK